MWSCCTISITRAPLWEINHLGQSSMMRASLWVLHIGFHPTEPPSGSMFLFLACKKFRSWRNASSLHAGKMSLHIETKKLYLVRLRMTNAVILCVLHILATIRFSQHTAPRHLLRRC
ncbi:unnamed protein product [Amoebophrya sp. A120]|nr:unnamed protein product [Amoebophrya sp. A120]|eukprot:GSA120T00009531001.1